MAREEGVERVVRLPIVAGSDGLRTEIASRIGEAAFAQSTWAAWIERRTLAPPEDPPLSLES